MTKKDRDRRLAFWLSFTYVMTAPIQAWLGLDIEVIKASAYALTGLGVANYFSKPSNSEG